MRSPSLARPSRCSRESSGSVRARWLIALAAVALAIAGAVFLHSLRRVSPVALRPLVAADFPHVRWISTEELAQKLDGAEERKILLLDVRTEEEFEVSHLESALRVEPGTTDFTHLALSPDALVVAYCSVGYRSAAVVDTVRQGVLRRCSTSRAASSSGPTKVAASPVTASESLRFIPTTKPGDACCDQSCARRCLEEVSPEHEILSTRERGSSVAAGRQREVRKIQAGARVFTGRSRGLSRTLGKRCDGWKWRRRKGMRLRSR